MTTPESQPENSQDTTRHRSVVPDLDSAAFDSATRSPINIEEAGLTLPALESLATQTPPPASPLIELQSQSAQLEQARCLAILDGARNELTALNSSLAELSERALSYTLANTLLRKISEQGGFPRDDETNKQLETFVRVSLAQQGLPDDSPTQHNLRREFRSSVLSWCATSLHHRKLALYESARKLPCVAQALTSLSSIEALASVITPSHPATTALAEFSESLTALKKGIDNRKDDLKAWLKRVHLATGRAESAYQKTVHALKGDYSIKAPSLFINLTAVVQTLHDDLSKRPKAVTRQLGQYLRATVEMIAPAFSPLEQPMVPYTAESGFTITDTQPLLSRKSCLARALAIASQCPVTIASATGQQLLLPPRISLELPGVGAGRPPELRAIFDTTDRTLQRYAGVCRPNWSARSLREALAASGFAGQATIQEEEPKQFVITFSRDVTLLGDTTFWELAHSLADSNVRIALKPGVESLYSAIAEDVGTSIPWRCKPNFENNSVYLEVGHDEPSKLSGVQALEQSIKARFGMNLSLNALALEETGRTWEPQQASLQSYQEWASLTPESILPAYLFATKADTDYIGNILILQTPVALAGTEMGQRIKKTPVSTPFFVTLQHKAQPVVISRENFITALKDLASDLKIPALCVADDQGKTTLSLPDESRLTSFKATCRLLRIAHSIAPLARRSIHMKWNEPTIAITNFFTDLVGHDIDWVLTFPKNKVVVETREDQAFSDYLMDAFKLCFESEFTVNRNPEPFSGIRLDPPFIEQRRMLPGEALEYCKTLRKILPTALGQPPEIRVQGNRTIVYSQSKNLPLEYLHKIESSLYGAPTPIYIREDHKATLISNPEILEEVIDDTIPDDLYMQQLALVDNTFELTLLNPTASPQKIDAYLRTIQPCAAYPIVWKSHIPSVGHQQLLSSAESPANKRFFAQAIRPDGSVASGSHLQRLIRREFEIADPTDLPSNLTRRLPVPIEDLTQLDCFSIDSEHTRIREDAVSVSRTSNGFRIGIHIVNGASLIRYGSAADVLARSRVATQITPTGIASPICNMLPLDIRKHFNLSLKKPVETFSLLFSITNDFMPIDGSARLCLARIANKGHLTHSDVLNRSVPANYRVQMQILNELLQRIKQSGPSSASGFPQENSAEVVAALAGMFNRFAFDLLHSAGIALPTAVDPISGEAVPFAKFTAPVRNFRVLLAQRQLDAFLSDTPPLSDQEIQFHMEHTGQPTSRGSAYEFYRETLRAERKAAGIPITIDYRGNLRR